MGEEAGGRKKAVSTHQPERDLDLRRRLLVLDELWLARGLTLGPQGGVERVRLDAAHDVLRRKAGLVPARVAGLDHAGVGHLPVRRK